MDVGLQTLVRSTAGYLKDSKEVLMAFHRFSWNEHYTWVTLDVVGLYSGIPHVLALVAIAHHLKARSPFPPDIQEFLISSIHFSLHHNYFRFNQLFYLQVKGWAPNFHLLWLTCICHGGKRANCFLPLTPSVLPQSGTGVTKMISYLM